MPSTGRTARRRRLLVATAATTLLAAAPASAALIPPVNDHDYAHCQPTFVDAVGGWFDFTDDEDGIGELEDGGVVNPTLAQPDADDDPGEADDAYDDAAFLEVFDRDAATPHDYDSPEDADVYGQGLSTQDCSATAIGADAGVAFPVLTLHGDLAVQRKAYVSSDRVGARFVDSVTNTSGATRKVTIQVAGGLGSDGGTTVQAASDGTEIASAASDWMVSSDSNGDDPLLGMVWSGPGAPHRADAAGFLDGNNRAGRGTAAPSDDAFYRYQDVTIPAGQTVSVLHYQVQSADGSAEFQDIPAQVPTAVQRTRALHDAPASEVFAGLDAATVRTVINWAQPAVAALPAPAVAAVVPPATAPTKAPVACTSVRRIVVHLRGRYASGTARIAGRSFTVKFGRNRARVAIDLKGKALGRYTLKLTLRTKGGRTVRDTRRYRTCAPGKG